MHKKKRAQVTVYIIIGMVILLLATLFFYLKGTTEKVQTVQELVRAQKIPSEIKPITTYVTASLDTAARKGLYLIGMQGGYIYDHQGGLTPDDAKTIFYGEHEVSYGIYKQETEYLSFYQPYPPEYPWDISSPATIFPYIAGTLNINSGHFGDENLPPLDDSGPSIQLQLESFITSYLQNLDLTLFKEHGFDITEGEMDVSVVIGENDVTVFLTYPLEITKRATNEVTNINYFYTNHQIRLKKIYNLAHDIINEDIVRVLFNISDPSNNKDSMTIKKITNANPPKHDDIIIINDDKSMLYAEPYTFQFARENRYPALHYIDQVLPFLFPSPPPFPTINEEQIKLKVKPKAYDPDEDELLFSYLPSTYQLEQFDFDNEYIDLTVYVKEKDNEDYQDWQDIDVGIGQQAPP